MKHVLSAAALAIALAMPPSAHAAMMVLGAGTARECYEAARDQRHGASALQACNSALNDDILDSHNRAATLINRGILYQQRHDYENAIEIGRASCRERV